MLEAFAIGFGRAIDIQMVGIGSGDNSHIRSQPVERTVELIRFDHGQVTFSGQHQVAVVVLQDATQKGIAIYMRLFQQMGKHRRGGCLTMRSGDAKAARTVGDLA